MKTCWQLVEVAFRYEQPLTQPTTFEGAVASWRLLVSWVSNQAGWTLIEKQVSEESAYATYKTPEHTLYGLWVKEAILTDSAPLPQMTGNAWLARSVAVTAIEATSDYTVDADRTPSEILDNLREGSEDVIEVAQNG